MTALFIASTVVAVFWILWMFRAVRDVTRAARDHKPILADRRHGAVKWMGIDELQVAVNQLIEEHRRHSLSAQGYLDQIRATLGSIREAVLLVDGGGTILLANDALRQILGASGMLKGRKLESVLQGADFYDYFRQVREGAAQEVFVLEAEVGDRVLVLEITGARLPPQEGVTAPLTLFVLHDITHQRNLERLRTEFVANVSHELRTPVTVIKGFVDALAEDGATLPENERRRFLGKVQHHVARLHVMLEDLLVLSRLESHPNAIQRERLSFNQVVGEAVEAFRSRGAPDWPEIRAHLDARPDDVMIDPLQIARVIDNLMENALRHAKGARTLTVRTDSREDFVVCEVRDDGAGIPEADLPHIFERFYRVDKGRSRESGGTGLGLSIVKHIVLQHGGAITAESRAGEGTTVRFRIPRPEQPAERVVGQLLRKGRGRASVRSIEPKAGDPMTL